METATIRDVAQLAGVSVATASRVLSGHPATSPQSRKRVREAANQLGFRVNAQARSLRKTRTNTVGVLLSDVRNPFFAEIAHAVEQRLLEEGVATLLCNANESTEQQDLCIELLVTQRVDAIIMAPQGDGEGTIRDLLHAKMPLVFVDRTVPDIDVPAITSDNETGVHAALDHLYDLGHRRIGLVAGPQQTSTGRARRTAFMAHSQVIGIDTDPELIYEGNFQQASGLRGAQHLLDLDKPPTAIIAADSPMTLGVLHELRNRGLHVGRDISVIGYDDLESFRMFDPPVSVIAHDPAAMGELAAAAIKELLNGKQPASIALPATLVLRESTGPAHDTAGA